MDDHTIIGWGYKLLRVLLFLLVILGLVFVWKVIRDHRPADQEVHRPQLRLLDEVYRLREQRLRSFYDDKIESAPNEVLSVKYQQERNLELENAQNLYFSDRQVILRGDYQVLRKHWSDEMEKLKLEAGKNESGSK